MTKNSTYGTHSAQPLTKGPPTHHPVEQVRDNKIPGAPRVTPNGITSKIPRVED